MTHIFDTSCSSLNQKSPEKGLIYVVFFFFFFLSLYNYKINTRYQNLSIPVFIARDKPIIYIYTKITIEMYPFNGIQYTLHTIYIQNISDIFSFEKHIFNTTNFIQMFK